ncbi:MAG: DNA-directed RNA polymerase subunit alpha C-terminal domain-containing protein, partial [Desulfatirhabdiaceae bacterium]
MNNDLSDTDAMPTFELGQAYYHKHDYAKAAEIWAELADQGDLNALYHLSLLYDRGQGVPENRKIHFEMLLKAYGMGHPDAKALLATCISANVDEENFEAGPPADEKPERTVFENFINHSRLSVKAKKIVLRNISSYDELARLSFDQLLKFQNCFIKTGREIIDFIQSFSSEAIHLTHAPNIHDSLATTCIPARNRKISGNLHQVPTKDILKLFPLFSGRLIKNIGMESLPAHYQPNYPLADIFLSNRTRNALPSGYRTVGELLLCPYPLLLRQRNFGRKSLWEIHQAVHDCILKPDANILGTEHYASFEKLVEGFICSVVQKKQHVDIVLQMLFQFDSGKKPTLMEVGKTHGLSKERIRQIVSQHVRRLKTPKNCDRIKRFWAETENVIDSNDGTVELNQLSMEIRD